jgi:hypothetical protein
MEAITFDLKASFEPYNVGALSGRGGARATLDRK